MNFQKLTEYLDQLHEVGIPGCDMAVYQDHKLLYRHCAGHRDHEKKQPMQGNETYCLYSCTKVFTTCAAMQLVERGLLHLDDPVSDYLPEYANLTVAEGDTVRPAKNVMLIRHLMSMQAGLDYDLHAPAIDALVEETKGQATTRQIAAAIAKKPLHFEPGTMYQYSLAHDVLAAVIEVASGKKFSEYLKENIFEPVGVKTMSFDSTEDIRHRFCAQYQYHEENDTRELLPEGYMNFKLSKNHESGGAGLMGDVQDYASFVDILACGGETAGGERIIQPETIQLWSSNQLEMAARNKFNIPRLAGFSYALGVRTRQNLKVGGKGSLSEFGWDGAAGSWCMIDPEHHLSCFFAMHVRGYPYAYAVVHYNLRNLIYEALEM
ncbi:MAG: beta-lactamase family protein [Clostridiales bacterium]|nr:beta-lactamase family protein [Clostridiales bacterium]